MTEQRPPTVELICTGRGTHEPRTLRVRSRYHVWDHDRGKPRTDPVSAAWQGAPADEYEYVVVCRTCRPPRRVSFTPEAFEKAGEELEKAGVSPVADISYMD